VTAPRILIVGPRLGLGGTERHLSQLIPALVARGLAEVLRLDGDAVYMRLVSQCPDPAA